MNYLITKENLMHKKDLMGETIFKKTYIKQSSCAGRSTCLMFKFLAQAMANDSVWVPVYDHYLYFSETDGMNSHRMMSLIMQHLHKSDLLAGWNTKYADSMFYIKFQAYELDPETLIEKNKEVTK